MTTWVYRCAECAMTFAVEVESGAEAPETTACPECVDVQADRAFALPETGSGCGCGCGNDCGC